MAPGRNSRKKNKQKVQSLVATVSKEFADSTSMHGIKYIANAEATIEERILWFLLFCGGLLFALFFSSKLWNNWVQYPIQITIQSANYPINQYDFPTVTVCSVNKISTRALSDWMTTDEAKDFDLDDIRQILKIIATNRITVSKDEMDRFSKLMDKARITSDRYAQLMHFLSPNCSDMFVHCNFNDNGIQDDCNVIFEEEATDGGYCCSFNSIVLHRQQSTSNLPKKTLVKSQTSGVYSGLTVILDAELHDYNITSSATVGFKVSIQSPDDFARTEKIGFMISPGTQVDAAVTGQAVFSDPRLKSIKIEQRECVIGDDEIHLKQFDTYTSPYCVLDCLTEILVEKCSCVPYYYPVPIAIPSCNISMYICVQQVIANYTTNSTQCNCPEQCNYIWYRNEITTGTYPNSVSDYPLLVIQRFQSDNKNGKSFDEYAKENFAKLNVYFKSTSGLRYIMDMRTTWADFISATGGLLGLGFGFSLISAAEVFYFMFVHWVIYFYRSRKQRNHQSATVNGLSPAVALVNNFVNENLSLPPNNQADDELTHPSRWPRIYDRITYPYYIYDDPWANTFYDVGRFNAHSNNTAMNAKPGHKNPRSNIPIRIVDH